MVCVAVYKLYIYIYIYDLQVTNYNALHVEYYTRCMTWQTLALMPMILSIERKGGKMAQEKCQMANNWFSAQLDPSGVVY